jgi:hypothetical protein
MELVSRLSRLTNGAVGQKPLPSRSPLARIDQLLNQGIVDQGHVVGVANEFKRWPGMGVD